jgi:hypothetical protein
MMTMSNAMKRPQIEAWKAWIIVMLLPLLASCSAVRVTYGQGPLLAYWWLDSRLDFSSDQAPRVRTALADWFAWHRSTQLPEYAQALGALAEQARADTTPAQVCSHIAAWQRRAERAAEPALPAAAEVLRSVSPAQIDHLARKLDDTLREAQDEVLQPDPAERREAALKRTVERAERLYGRLEPAQQTLLAEALATSPFDPERWLAERRARNADLLATLRQWQAAPTDAATVQAGLRRLIASTVQSPRPAYAAYSRQLMQANCALIAQLHNATTPAQRQRAATRLTGWQDDLRTLAATPR